jgi:hypothetical protein
MLHLDSFVVIVVVFVIIVVYDYRNRRLKPDMKSPKMDRKMPSPSNSIEASAEPDAASGKFWTGFTGLTGFFSLNLVNPVNPVLTYTEYVPAA